MQQNNMSTGATGATITPSLTGTQQDIVSSATGPPISPSLTGTQQDIVSSATGAPISPLPTETQQHMASATGMPPTPWPTTPKPTADASLTTAPSDAARTTLAKKSEQQRRKCRESECNNDTCKCEGECKCKSKSGKPDKCQSPNPVDCSDGSCELSKSEDPTNVGLVTNGKCLGPALNAGAEQPQKPECHGKKEGEKESERTRCPLSGDCDGSKQPSSLVLWHPHQGSPREQTAEQKGESVGPKRGLKPCAHPENNIHKQEEHHKICSPLPQGDKLKAILFDIDGTIADSDPIHFLAFQEILAEAGYNGGVPISHEFFIRQMSGKLNYVIAEELMPEMDEKKRIEMMDEKEVRYRQLAAKGLQPIPGFLQFAEYVKKRGLRRAAVTNSPRLNAEQVIAALKIPDFFETVVVGSECDNPKPSPDPYLKAIKFLGVEASQCFVLEDSPSGIKAGRAAGSPVVGLLTGHPGPVLRDNGASVLIQDYNDSALWIALGEDRDARSGSQGHDSTPSTGVPAPPAHNPDSTPSTGVPAPVPVPA